MWYSIVHTTSKFALPSGPQITACVYITYLAVWHFTALSVENTENSMISIGLLQIILVCVHSFHLNRHIACLVWGLYLCVCILFLCNLHVGSSGLTGCGLCPARHHNAAIFVAGQFLRCLVFLTREKFDLQLIQLFRYSYSTTGWKMFVMF